MRAGIENWLSEHWYGAQQPPWYLRLLEPLYRKAYQRKQRNGQDETTMYRPGLPLVVVGNITAGGSGKTPLVLRLCELALEMNLKPGIASTGYGRQGRDTLLVLSDSDPRLCGDEPVMLAKRTGVPVVVSAKRTDAVKALCEMELDLIFSDDGLQQADLDRDIEFCVIDGERGLGNGHLIPAGPLRESAERLKLVNFVVSNGEWAGKPDDVEVDVMRLDPQLIISLDESKTLSVNEFTHKNTGKDIHSFAGIGNPTRFFRMLEDLEINTHWHGFPDHHTYVKEDFDSISGDSVIIMTEKDAIKCRLLGLKNAWYVPVETQLSDKLENSIKRQLTKLMKGVR